MAHLFAGALPAAAIPDAHTSKKHSRKDEPHNMQSAVMRKTRYALGDAFFCFKEILHNRSLPRKARFFPHLYSHGQDKMSN
jgi:hypothetical protein